MRIETAAARGRPPSGRVERRARAATRGGGLTIDVLAYGIDSGAFSTAAATGAAPVCSSTALRQTAAAFLELQSPTVADALSTGATATGVSAPLLLSKYALSCRASPERQRMEKLVLLWRPLVSAPGCSWVQCCGEGAREGAAVWAQREPQRA